MSDPTALLVITATMAAAPLTASSEEVNRYVLAIGYNRSSSPGRPTLRYADDDAARFFELLSPGARRAHLLVSFDQDSREVFSRTSAQADIPSRSAVEAAVKDLKSRIAEDKKEQRKSELFFFYAGHGDVEDGMGYINLSDGRLTREQFTELMWSGPRADATHVVIDACKSYYLVAGRGAGGRRERQLVSFAGPDPIDGVGYILSTSSDADSHEWSAFSGGIFSHEVRSALVGSADLNNDSVVDYEELAAFVAVANEAVPFPNYRPTVYIKPPPGNARAKVYQLNSKEATMLQLHPAEGGRVSIIDQRGLRYADLNKATGHSMQVMLLRPLRYEVRWQDRSYSVDTAEDAIQLGALTPDPEYLASRGEIHRAFEHLFGTPLDLNVLRGYRLGAVGPVLAAEMTVAETEHSWLPTGLLSGGVATIAGGVVLTILSANARADITTASQQDRAGLADRADNYAVGAGVTYGVGLVSLGTGLYLLLSEQ